MDYAMPRAEDFPMFKLDTVCTPCTHNPLGTKGCGEAGAIGSPPAVINAVLDALAPLGVKDFDMPASPHRVWEAMQKGSVSPTQQPQQPRWPPVRKAARLPEHGRKTPCMPSPSNVPPPLADAVKLAAARRQAAGRRPDPAGVDEAAPGATRSNWPTWAAIKELAGIRKDGNAFVIGAMARHCDVAEQRRGQGRLSRRWPSWPAHIGDRQVRAHGHHRRLGGQQRSGRLLSQRGAGLGRDGRQTTQREIAADDFFQGMFATALEDGELITAIRFPIPKRAAYEKLRQKASQLPARSACSSRSPTAACASRSPAAATACSATPGWKTALTQELHARSGGRREDRRRATCRSDLHASAAYRANLISVMAQRAVAKALSSSDAAPPATTR